MSHQAVVASNGRFVYGKHLGSRYAILCTDVVKRFPLIDEGVSWRLVLGMSSGAKAIEALRGVSLSVPKGKIVGILGGNGAGKSTLLRVMGGVYSASSGSVSVRGGVASLFELGGMGNRFISGREYAERLLRLQGISGRRLRDLVLEIAQFSELESFFDRRIYTYSAGMAARLYFSTATAIDQDVYLIDEVLSVGDEHFQAKCWRRIRERLTRGASGVVVTHDWSAVIKLCEVSHILERGRISYSGPSDVAVARYLSLPRPDRKFARFVDVKPKYPAISGHDWEVSFVVSISAPSPVEIAFSIEMLRLGIGWEVLILSSFHPVAASIGNFKVAIRIPRLPLAPGEYLLNLFLRARTDDGLLVNCDTLSWTYGSGIGLTVGGNRCRTPTRLPVTWRSGGKLDA